MNLKTKNVKHKHGDWQAKRLNVVSISTTGPLLRLTLLQLDEVEYVLLLNLHHIIADGWSIGVLIKELGTLYKAFLEDKQSPLPELPIQYADFAEWQRGVACGRSAGNPVTLLASSLR
jgi:NRPS condensation-like uncharacterized protein